MQAFGEDPGISCFKSWEEGTDFTSCFGICFANTGPSGSCEKTSSKGGNVLKRKLHTLLFLPHQRLLSLNAPVCRHLLS